MKIDPYNHKRKYLDWKERTKNGIPGISMVNSDIILAYINDMEKGINVSSSGIKGARSYPRLNNIRGRLMFFTRKFEEIYSIDNITKITEEQLICFFSDMKNGTIKRCDGNSFESVDTYVRIFKAFWHWYMKVNKKKGEIIPDITTDLDTSREKPKWVYLTEDQIKKMCNNAKFNYRVLIMFLFDTGIRSPTELVNVKISDLYNECKEVHIREEISKTFGRRIKLMLCSDLIEKRSPQLAVAG